LVWLSKNLRLTRLRHTKELLKVIISFSIILSCGRFQLRDLVRGINMGFFKLGVITFNNVGRHPQWVIHGLIKQLSFGGLEEKVLFFVDDSHLLVKGASTFEVEKVDKEDGNELS